MGQARIKEINRRATKIEPIEGKYARFVSVQISVSGGWLALDTDGKLWTRMPVQDGTQDKFGNPRVVWVQLDDERCTYERSALVDPS